MTFAEQTIGAVLKNSFMQHRKTDRKLLLTLRA
jgi:hypothetical protein